MNPKETNVALRCMVNNLIDQGWSKTKIARALLGDNGQGHVNHWLSNNDGHVNDFGIKPLITIADQLKYEIHLVFVPKASSPENDQIKKQLNNYNTIFISNLSDALVQFLEKKLDEKPKIIPRKTTTKLDQILNELLGTPEVLLNTNDNEPINDQINEEIDQTDLAPEER